MKIEVIWNRGLTIMIDGKRPSETNWGFGEPDDGFLGYNG